MGGTPGCLSGAPGLLALLAPQLLRPSLPALPPSGAAALR
jgi:hypothetical protein